MRHFAKRHTHSATCHYADATEGKAPAEMFAMSSHSYVTTGCLRHTTQDCHDAPPALAIERAAATPRGKCHRRPLPYDTYAAELPLLLMLLALTLRLR